MCNLHNGCYAEENPRGYVTVKPVLSGHKNGFQDRLLLNAGQKYCRIIQVEHSVILLTFIVLLFVIKIFVLSILVAAQDLFYCINVLSNAKCFNPFHSEYQ